MCFICCLFLFEGSFYWLKEAETQGVKAKKTHIRYRAFVISAIMLLFLNLALICPIVLMVKFEKPVNMELIPAIAMAAYTTYKITMASIHFHKQKSRRHKNMLITELRTVNFIDALVSVLTLQNTLIIVNGAKSNADNLLVLSAISSAVIYIVIIFITIRLLVAGVKQHGNDIFSKSCLR